MTHSRHLGMTLAFALLAAPLGATPPSTEPIDEGILATSGERTPAGLPPASAGAVGARSIGRVAGRHEMESEQEEITEFQPLVCDESVGFFPVDPAVARAHVPPEYDLFYLEDGRAQIMVLIQECTSMLLNGEVELAPLKMFHVWIRRDGPFELIPIPGALETLPTFYWYQHADMTDSRALFVAAKQAGGVYAIAESITRGPAIGFARVSRVVEKQVDGESIGFDWVQSVNAFPPVPLGVRHRVVVLQGWTNDDPNDVEKLASLDDRGLAVFHARDNEIAITPHPRSVLAKFGEVLYGFGHDFSIDFTSTSTTTDLTQLPSIAPELSLVSSSSNTRHPGSPGKDARAQHDHRPGPGPLGRLLPFLFRIGQTTGDLGSSG